MKMYILVREWVDVGHAMVATAHASLACYLKFRDSNDMKHWLQFSFKKVICKVTDAEFEAAKATEDHVVLTESWLDNQEVAIAFCPREEYPKGFKFFKKYR